MKYLKYILLGMLIATLSLENVEAKTCKWGVKDEYVECTLDEASKDISCSMTSKVSKLADNYTKPPKSAFDDCSKPLIAIVDNTGVIYSFDLDETGPLQAGRMYLIYDRSIPSAEGKSCSFKSQSLKYSCVVKNGFLNCSMGCVEGVTCNDNYDLSNIRFGLKSDYFLDDNTGEFVCPNAVYYSFSIGINGKEKVDEVKNTFATRALNYYAGSVEPPVVEQDYETLHCIFTNSILSYSCTIANGAVDCYMGCTEGSICADNFDISHVENGLTIDDFQNNSDDPNAKKFVCPSTIHYTQHTVNKKTIIDEVNMSGRATLNYAPNASEPNVPSQGVPPIGGNDDPIQNDDPTQGTETTFDTSTFCEGPVLGTFTTLGWVFFIIKIVIPIILIVMASVDFAKAIVANKETDELKKAAQTLAKRAILAILIFFVPTILNFALGWFDKDDLYHGDFVDCTKCMLDPFNSNCSKLFEDL